MINSKNFHIQDSSEFIEAVKREDSEEREEDFSD